MAVSIDNVYQKVLAITNKEQRGYITPQEFKLFADQAQMEIFEQYFYDINQFRRISGNDHAYANILSNLEDKISIFKRHDVQIQHLQQSNGYITINRDNIDDIYRIGLVKYKYKHDHEALPAVEAKMEDMTGNHEKSPLTYSSTISTNPPIYFKLNNQILGDRIIRVKPPVDVGNGGKIWLNYIKTPSKPNWGYVVVNNKPLYNANSSQDFELHLSEESELVYKILTLFGINLQKPDLAQAAAQMEVSKILQEQS